jgi:hypothetical protein
MSKEGSTYKNPIKSYTDASKWTIEQKAIVEQVFSNQTPGTFLQDMGQDIGGGTISQSVWYCTKYVTSALNIRIWVRTFLNGTKVVATTNYAILIKSGEANSGVSFFRTTAGVTEKRITSAFTGRFGQSDSINQRWKFQWGAYTFIGLSAPELESLKKQLGGGSETRVTIPGAAAASTPETNIETTNSANSRTTGGRSGSGKNNEETSNSPRTVTNAEKAWALNNPAGVDFTPKAPKKSSKSNKSSRNNAPQKNPNNGLSTVTIKKMPEKIYSNGIKFTNTNPYIEQRYTIPGPINSEGVSEIRQIVRRHIFDIIPNTFEFSNLSSAWEEVPRNGNFNMVDWSKYNLTKVGFKFLIQGTRTDTFNFEQQKKADGSLIPIPPPISTIVNDGMSISIDEQVANIRQIGAAPYPVRLYNLNTLLTDEYRFPYESPGKGILWVIGDMNITASRVTPKAKNIAVAEVNISLIEYPEIGRDIIFLPPLVPTQPVPKCVGKKCKTTTTTPLGLQVEGTYGYVPKNDYQSPSPSQPDTTPA